MGVTAAMYAWGFQYENLISPTIWKALWLVTEQLKHWNSIKKYTKNMPLRDIQTYMEASLDAYKSGQVAMQMNWYAFWPGVNKDPDVGGGKSDFCKS